MCIKWALYSKSPTVTVRTEFHIFLERLPNPDWPDAEEDRKARVENRVKRPISPDDGVNE